MFSVSWILTLAIASFLAKMDKKHFIIPDLALRLRGAV
jgi:hypothetical protein